MRGSRCAEACPEGGLKCGGLDPVSSCSSVYRPLALVAVNCKGCWSPGDKDCGDPSRGLRASYSRGQCVHTCTSVSTHTYKYTHTQLGFPQAEPLGKGVSLRPPPPRLQCLLSGVDASVAGCPSLCTCCSCPGSMPWPVLCSLPQPVLVKVMAPLL